MSRYLFVEVEKATDNQINYTPGEWFDATSVDLMQRFYESRLPAIREAAREHGYAIGVHGSMRRDLDLIAAPWTEDASGADTLAHAIATAACGITRKGSYDWERKPLGRLATCIPICWTHRHDVLSDEEISNLHSVVHKVLKHHKLTERGNGVVEADLIYGILAKLADRLKDAERYAWLLANYARGDGYDRIDQALNDGNPDTQLSPAIDAAKDQK